LTDDHRTASRPSLHEPSDCQPGAVCLHGAQLLAKQQWIVVG
jgi:hypothetical protein